MCRFFGIRKWSKAPIWNLIKTNEVKKSYENNFGKEFVYGDLPDYNEVINSIKLIQKHLENVGE